MAEYEEGPKNPLKGITVKPVVSASYAQSGVDAGGRCANACGGRAVLNGMRIATRSLWRPEIVQRRTPFVVRDCCTIPDVNLHCGATRLYAVNAVCSVACLAWIGREREAEASGHMALCRGRYSLESLSAKEDKIQIRLLWKAPRLSFSGNHGIAVRTKWQSGTGFGDRPAWRGRGNRLLRRREVLHGENRPDLSRKINHDCRHCVKNHSSIRARRVEVFLLISGGLF